MNQLYQCRVCKVEKEPCDFNKSSTSKTGLQDKCRQCEKDYRIKNKNKIKARTKKYNQDPKNKERNTLKRRVRQQTPRCKELAKLNRIKHKDSIKLQKQHYYQENKDILDIKHKNWRLNNLEKYRKYQREYAKHKRDTDLHYKLEHRLRNRLLAGLKKNGNKKLDRFWNLVGCTKKELKIHIENQFTNEMTWELFNSGKIVIDHIKPCCSFDLSKVEEQQICFNYKNLKPLWLEDNQEKISSDLKQSIKNTRNFL